MSDGRNRAASDTSETHWGAAGKRQLVGLRYSIWLGGRRPGRRPTLSSTHWGSAGRRQLVRLRYSIRLGTVRKQHRDYRRFWRAAGAFSCKNTPTAPQTTPLPQFFFTKSSRTAGRHSRKGPIPGNKRRQRGGFRPISAENRRRHTGVPAEYTAQENGNSTEK